MTIFSIPLYFLFSKEDKGLSLIHVFFFIQLNILEKNGNLPIKIFDSIPNAQHENLNKAKKMKEQKN